MKWLDESPQTINKKSPVVHVDMERHARLHLHRVLLVRIRYVVVCLHNMYVECSQHQ